MSFAMKFLKRTSNGSSVDIILNPQAKYLLKASSLNSSGETMDKVTFDLYLTLIPPFYDVGMIDDMNKQILKTFFSFINNQS